MDDLRPAILDDYGLVSALHWYTDKYRERTGLEAMVRGDSLSPRLNKDQEIALFRITQEALTNITRHAKASKINIIVSPSDAEVMLRIEDDGVGFDLKEIQKDQKGQGWGLINIQERVSRIGGSLEILTQPGEGTQLVITLPRE
jgi:signal transduction histidine kinase